MVVLGNVVAVEASGIRGGGKLQAFLVLLGLSDIVSSLDMIENTEAHQPFSLSCLSPLDSPGGGANGLVGVWSTCLSCQSLSRVRAVRASALCLCRSRPTCSFQRCMPRVTLAVPSLRVDRRIGNTVRPGNAGRRGVEVAMPS